jgi:menaquinone-dependent protoporphyrinogen IX oxidase
LLPNIEKYAILYLDSGEPKMKQVIVYKSKTGFTKQYAMWISEATGIEVKSIKEIKLKSLSQYDRIIYGESLLAGHLSSYKKVKKYNANIVCFVVGLSPYEKVNLEQLKKNANVDGIVFYLMGGVKYEKLNFLFRAMLKKITGFLENQDFTNKEAIKEIVDYINKK